MTTTVLYIGGCTRSGSTLVDRLLGQFPGIVSTGEFGLITTHGVTANRLCGCGKRFHECEFWSAVGQRAFGGWDTEDARALVSLHPQVTRQRHIPLLLWPSLSPRFNRAVTRYRDLLGRLYGALAEVSGASVVVDSTKAPAYALVLRGAADLQVRTLHLVRDSRGTAFSAGKVEVMKDSVDATVYKDRYPPAQITLRWIVYHLLFDALSLVDHKTLGYRYEDFVREPRDFMRRALGWLGVNAIDSDLSFAGRGAVDLGVNHSVAGNDLRFVNGHVTLREDDKWRSALNPGSRRLVTVMSWPLLKRWGYV